MEGLPQLGDELGLRVMVRLADGRGWVVGSRPGQEGWMVFFSSPEACSPPRSPVRSALAAARLISPIG